MGASSEYSAEDLLLAAADAGTPATSRLITDWVAKGLLDRPMFRGLGRGRGTSATWPDSQRLLFLKLLRERHDGRRRIQTLCNIPVAVWLYSEPWEPERVPLRQVRRCMATWASGNQPAPANL